MKIEFTINGELRAVETSPLGRLIDIIRNDLDLTGCKEGCGEGECGACAVMMNAELVNACLIPAIQVAGAEIITIEGLAKNNTPDALQEAFINKAAIQCGFCTPGMIMAACSVLAQTPKPTLEEIRVGLSGNLCRCTGYNSIYRAVNAATEKNYKISFKKGDFTNKPVFSPEEKERFFSPHNLNEALEVLAKEENIVLLAGITDIGAELKSGELDVKTVKAMDIFNLSELKQIEEKNNVLHIGSVVTDTQIVESSLLNKYFPALVAAALKSAGPAIRNRATIGGNICTASGAADLPVALLALNAKVRVKSKNGERTMFVHEFIEAYRKVDLQKGELLLDILLEIPPKTSKQVFYKRGSREALTLSRASLAVYVDINAEKTVTQCFAACGSMSPTPIRLPKLEEVLKGQKINEETIKKAVLTVRDEINPRRSPKYRKAMAGNLLRRFLETL